MSQILEATSHQPIDFYGRVVDQTGAPVADADIRGNVEISRRWMDQTWEEHHTITDADGRFSFSGLHGQNLVVTPRKDGYSYKEATKDVFAYSALSPERERHKPDTSDPVVFTMWKQKGPEPLVHTRMDRIPVPVDGTIVTIDLLTAKKVQDHGDLSVKLERDPQHITRGKPFSWKAVIAVPDGGLIATHDEYANEAPANGYRPAVEFNMLPAAPDWHSSIRETYYAKLRNGGAFARITIRITADYEPPPTGVTIEAFVNPSGSRNLEFDPTKVIRR